MQANIVYGLHIIDLATIFLYFMGMMWIGYRAMKRIRNREDYFLGGRRFGKWIQTFAAFGQGTSAESAVSMTTMVNTNGAAGIWSNLAGGLLCMPIFWFTSLWYRRMRILTFGDFFEERFDSKVMAGFYAVCQTIFFMIVVALGFFAMSKTVSAIAVKPTVELNTIEKAEYDKAMELEQLQEADYAALSTKQQARLHQLRIENPRKEFSYISENILIIIVAAIVLVYAVAGGLEAAYITDMIQGIFIILLSLILIPFAIVRINQLHGAEGIMGTFKTMHDKLPEAFFEIWGSPHVIEFTWYWILAYSILVTFNVAVQANQVIAAGSAKDEKTARFGFLTGIFLKRYCNVIWGFVALMTVTLYAGVVKNPDYVWGYATRDLLGPVGFGLVGLMIACLMAALMSTADALMITTSGLLTHNVYRPLVPNKSERHYIWAGRGFSVVYIIGGVLIATSFKSVFVMFKLIWTFNCILAAAFWLGMLWRRANRLGAWTSMIVTFLFTVFFPTVIPLFPGVRTNDYLAKVTQTAPIVRTYTAREMDVAERKQQIDKWDRLNTQGRSVGNRPEPLTAGQSFEKTYTLPAKSIFWAEDFDIKNGRRCGSGMLKVELVFIDWLGFDLSKHSYSLNETISALLRIIIPFGTMILVSLTTRPDDQQRLDLFYGKMHTPVKLDRTEDRREMALTYVNPHRFDHTKLFPNSNWEFRKWNRDDIKGVVWSIIGVAGCVLLLYLMVHIGA